MYATLENRTHGKKRPCVRHPDYLYTYFVDTTLEVRGGLFVIKEIFPATKRRRNRDREQIVAQGPPFGPAAFRFAVSSAQAGIQFQG